MEQLILRQAAIDALRTCYDTETITMDNGDEYINYGDAVGEIEQLPPIQPEPHWIPVTERLPEESGLYQVTDRWGNVVRYVFNTNGGSVDYWKRCVKAWMPLPEPYKGVTE